jgi:hypothetical protein
LEGTGDSGEWIAVVARRNLVTSLLVLLVLCVEFQDDPFFSVCSDSAAMDTLNLTAIHDFAVELAKNAGQMILKASNTRLSSPSTTMAEKKNCLFHPSRSTHLD